MRFKIFAIILFLTAVCLFSQQDDWYEGREIGNIIFSGLVNINRSEIEAIINPYIGRIYDIYTHMEIQGRLLALEYFNYIETNIQPSSADGDVIINFIVFERPVISRINFVGNSGIRRSQLLEVTSSRVSDIFNTAKVRIDIEAIRNRYIESGYPNVTVTSSERESGENSIILTFHIDEGTRITISNIEFEGNASFSDRTLRGQLSLRTRTLFNDGAFQEAKLLADIESITRYYHDRGFIDAVVRDVTRTFETDERHTNMTITFLIDEGSVFTFGGITFQGNEIFSDAQLERLVNSRVGEIVNSSRLEADLQRVADLYFENGYIFNSIIRVPEKNYEENVLSYTVSIVERGRAYIENIIIRGNVKTKTEVILREIPMEPGEVFSRTKIMDAMRNLHNLQFFSVIIPEPTIGSAENLMDLIFTVEEMPTTDVQFGLTFSGSVDPDTFPISGLLKWTDRNLAGTGNQLGAELTSTVVDTFNFSLNYLHRWVFGLPLSIGTDLSINYSRAFALMNNNNPLWHGDEPGAFPDPFTSYDEYISHSRLPPRDYLMEFNQWFLSLGISTGYRWITPAGILGLNGGIRTGLLLNTFDDDLYRPFDPTLRAGNNTWTPRNSFWSSISLDQRDVFYDPSRGFYLFERIGVHGILPNENEHYLRSDTRAQIFFTLFDFRITENWNFKTVLGFHTGLSIIWDQPGRDLSVAENNKLAVDGMFIGRGWTGEFRNKGLLLWDNWIELRIPLVRGILAWDFFLDAAGVETEEGFYFFGRTREGKPNFTIDNMRFSLGGGFRFTMPQFPFRLSLAKRFRFIDGELTWEPGALFGGSGDSTRGLDLVISFVIPY